MANSARAPNSGDTCSNTTERPTERHWTRGESTPRPTLTGSRKRTKKVFAKVSKESWQCWDKTVHIRGPSPDLWEKCFLGQLASGNRVRRRRFFLKRNWETYTEHSKERKTHAVDNSGPESALKRAKDACGICTRMETLERVVAKSNKSVARFRRPFFERPTERQWGQKCTQKSDRRRRCSHKNGKVKRKHNWSRRDRPSESGAERRKLNWPMRDLWGKLRRHMLKHNWIPSDNGPGGNRTPDRPWPTVLQLPSGTLTGEKRNFPKKVLLFWKN